MAGDPGLGSALNWRKSSGSSGGGECVEVAQRGASILVRDSRDPSGAVLVLGPEQWDALLRRVRSEIAQQAR
jgi:hypothetical protein